METSTEKTVIIVGIRFRPAGRIYYFDPQGQSFTTGQYVIVETARGVEAGRVVIASRKLAESDLTDPLKPIQRFATEDDLRMMLSFKAKEKEALVRCAERVAHHRLPMKLVESEYTFDGSRLTFYFTAEERVDFRILVRDLAATFRTRIELRQIGARDQAKLQGGIGPCGKTLCCSSWITEFGVVSIKMAKEQGLPLNPTKISGICGRLLCCLSYENDNYIQAKQQMPAIGSMLNTPSGYGKVVSINVPRNTVEVMLESGATIQVPANTQSPNKNSSVANPTNDRKSMLADAMLDPIENNAILTTSTIIEKKAHSCGGGCSSGGCGSGGCSTRGGGCGSCGTSGGCSTGGTGATGCSGCGVKKNLQT